MLHGLAPLPGERVSLEDAQGRVLAEAIDSRLTLPPWDNSAMDGFAVRSGDVNGATRETPVVLDVIGEAAAGRAAGVEVRPGTAVRILTGAPLTAGADAVVPIEDTDAPMGAAALPDKVAVYDSRPPGAHVRRAGSDLRRDYPLLAAGAVMTPAAMAVAAAGGHADVLVHGRPRVAILATGNELAPIGRVLGEDEIPDSNSVGLAAQGREAGAEVRSFGIARDDLDDVVDHLRRALDWAHVVVVSGGVSVGAHDVVKDAFASVGDVELWRVAVQPGKPLAFARAEGALLFGLPGNPVSSFVTFELFVRPVLRQLAGHADVIGRESVKARLGEDVTKSPNRRAFLRVRLDRDPENSGLVARLAGGQDSHVLSALAAADGLAIIPEEDDTLPAGSEVEVIRLR